jgi:hypothetical protein
MIGKKKSLWKRLLTFIAQVRYPLYEVGVNPEPKATAGELKIYDSEEIHGTLEWSILDWEGKVKQEGSEETTMEILNMPESMLTRVRFNNPKNVRVGETLNLTFKIQPKEQER